MGNGSKKGFFSFKKKKEESHDQEPEKKGFFSRFRKDKSKEEETTVQPVHETAVATEPEETVTAAQENHVQTAVETPVSEVVAPPVEETPAVEEIPPQAEEIPVVEPQETPTPEVAQEEPVPETIEETPTVTTLEETEPTQTTTEQEDAESEEKKKGWFSKLKGDKAEKEEAQADTDEEKPKKNWFSKLKSGLSKTRNSLKGKLNGIFLVGRKIDEDLLEELEEMLISADIGVTTSMDIIETVRTDVDRKVLQNGEELKHKIQEELENILNGIPNRGIDLDKNPTIILVVGVNGVGKTTTIGKIANLISKQGKSVVVCAADTFRAAAVEQLQVWSERAGVDIVLKEGSKDPAAVVFDALERVKETNADVLIIDTAGRLHNNPNLMNELGKIHKIIGRSFPEAPHHCLLILDAATGQNGLSQAKQFVSKVGVTDLVITKLDGTAKGGIAIAIAKELNMPIQYIGVGEQMDDLLPFDSKNFVTSLFEE